MTSALIISHNADAPLKSKKILGTLNLQLPSGGSSNLPELPRLAEQARNRATGQWSVLSPWVRFAAPTLIGCVFLVLISRMIAFREVAAIASQARLWPLLLGVLAYAGGFVLRAVRFWLMLRTLAGVQPPLGASIPPFIASFGISDILPFRAGDGFRILWFRQRFGIKVGSTISVMLIERLFDLAAIVGLGAVAIGFAGSIVPSSLDLGFELVLVATALAALAILYAPGLVSRLLRHVMPRRPAAALHDFLDTMEKTARLLTRQRGASSIAGFFAISIICWLLEALVFVAAWTSLGGSTGALQAPALAFVFSTLGTLLPGLPGHFGSFEFFGIQSLTIAGVAPALAGAVVLLAHLLLWLPTALFAIGWTVISPQIRTAL